VTEYNLEKLLETYSEMVVDEYKTAIISLKNQEELYKPPTIDVTHATVLEAADHVQRCSSYYGSICKVSGFAVSAFDLVEGRYKQAYRKALGESTGKNEAAREADAAEATSEELDDLLFFQSAVKLFAALERAARVAADSSRKIADLVQSHHIAEVGNKY